ncbi:tRNA lysidine(34) synthetase TilS [Ideonella sp. YS5]|uniref:tRNA lysidine(34) synthetase TilS n=1 Tax=Ideonella sp. YS5 TaxID=3453714 RepID=UPI003EEDE41A
MSNGSASEDDAARPAVVAVAASGGRDSTALLHATAQLARGTSLQVAALHVHHGLNPAADDWLEHLRRQCERWARAGWPVSLRWHRLDGRPARGESVEAWARKERYLALAAMARDAGAGVVLLAHHRRDQAETVLLQALRGAGTAGLSAMPREVSRDDILWCRPWLERPADAIAAYVRRHRLSHIEDDSNQDRRFDRNRLRHDLWPALLGAFSNAESSLLHVAAQAQWAQQLVQEVTRADLARVLDPERALDVSAWLALTPARRIGALRVWLADAGVAHGLDHLSSRVAAELPGRSTAQWPADGQRQLRLYRGRLVLVPLRATPLTEPLSNESPALDRPGRHALSAWGGLLELVAVDEGGVSTKLLSGAVLRARLPGDQFQWAPRSVARSLKKQYQDRGVPAWQRGGPIVAAGDQVLFVPGLGIDARAMAPAGEPQLAVRWHPDC